MGMAGFPDNRRMPLRDQARSRRARRKRTIRAASAVEFRRKGGAWLRRAIRTLPKVAYLLLLILSGWLLYYSLNSPYFAVREVVVSGTHLLDREQVRGVTEVEGRSVLLLRSDGIVQSVRSIVAVREVEIVLALPDRVAIEVVERTPFAQWQGRDSAFLVDEDGVLFSQELPSSLLPVVVDLDGPALELGSRVDPGVLVAVKALREGLSRQLGVDMWRFEYSHDAGIAVALGETLRVVFGDAGNLDAKLESLVAIQEHLKRTDIKAETIDVRFKGRPTYTVSSSPETAAKTLQ
jgi:cell division protein FtsQ